MLSNTSNFSSASGAEMSRICGVIITSPSLILYLALQPTSSSKVSEYCSNVQFNDQSKAILYVVFCEIIRQTIELLNVWSNIK